MSSNLSAEFKQAMRGLAATVTLITSGSGENRAGIAATAVASICVDPPTLMVGINRSSSLCSVIEEKGEFCVNILNECHKELVHVFGGSIKGVNRFEYGEWTSSNGGLPVLADAQTSLICSVTSKCNVGTHTMYLGVITEVINGEKINPLLWVDGSLALSKAC